LSSPKVKGLRQPKM